MGTIAKDKAEKEQTTMFNKYGVFFAFSEAQFKEGKQKLIDTGLLLEGEKLTKLPLGMLAPSKNAKVIMQELKEIHKRSKEEDLKENGKEGIIKRELYNHEAFYTGEIIDTVDALEFYGFTYAEVLEVYKKEHTNAMEYF